MPSVALAAGAARAFGAAHTTVHPLHPEHATALVTSGPNRITRNPMYVGMAGLLTAHAVLRGGLGTLVPLAGFVAVIDRLQIAPEEAALRAKFGDAYLTYCAEVPRWIGPIRAS